MHLGRVVDFGGVGEVAGSDGMEGWVRYAVFGMGWVRSSQLIVTSRWSGACGGGVGFRLGWCSVYWGG